LTIKIQPTLKVRGAVQFGFDELETMPFHCGMKSVPPRGSGRVLIGNCQLPISDWHLAIKLIGNRKSRIGNQETHPLRRGGTDFMSLQGRLWSVFDIVIRQTASIGIGIAGHSLPEAILLRISFN
jgi:hypothetical protein